MFYVPLDISALFFEAEFLYKPDAADNGYAHNIGNYTRNYQHYAAYAN